MMKRRHYNTVRGARCAVRGTVIGAALALLSLPALAQTTVEGGSGGSSDSSDSCAAPGKVSFSRTVYSACEGENATLIVKKDGDGEAAVAYTTADADSTTQATAGVDYVATSGALHFGTQDTEKTITVRTKTDTDVTERSEVLMVELSLPSWADGQETATFGQSWAVVTILNVGTSC